MNDLQIFRNETFGEIRTLEINGEPWFVAADVCRALEISNPTDALKRLDDDEKARFNLGLSGGATNCVNEPGLYGLVLGSRKPEAKAFKRWIKHDVLPSIRKTGGYNLPKDYPSALRALADAEEKRLSLEAELDRSKEWYSIKRVAAINGCSWKRFDWRKLKAESIRQGYGVKKIFDANYTEVNTYHMNVLETVYPYAEL